ncbi:metallophosphatase family protein [Butyrivibrio fibrisolvens]|uniref:metallophosphoesterase family protein n=1 Tax=Pseudobutyrivibrio ruminis TaxID=46206 RepID=UPI0004084928|nr:metallophosphoesterase family protein [Pseudobutyrivibrio ruminis]MDC7280171.1 metallophosphatase family protein [Butyrivibrio fibrisolvens]
MKVAVLSDIHGNYHALENCLQDAKDRGAEKFWFLGDYLGEFPYPQKTMEILYKFKEENDCVFIRGNKENYWLDRKYNPDCEWIDGNSTVGAMKYCYKYIEQKDLDFFESLPISRHVVIQGMEPVLLCHGSAENNRQKLLPNDEKTREIVENYHEKYILCGHSHVQGVVLDSDKLVLNAGSVGVPMNSVESSKYLMLESDGSQWKYDFITLPMDVDKVEEEIRQSELMEYAPFWSRSVIHVLRTGEISQGTALSKAMEIDEYKSPWYLTPDECWEKALEELGIG